MKAWITLTQIKVGTYIALAQMGLDDKAKNFHIKVRSYLRMANNFADGGGIISNASR